jgi:hypothetical protein
MGSMTEIIKVNENNGITWDSLLNKEVTCVFLESMNSLNYIYKETVVIEGVQYASSIIKNNAIDHCLISILNNIYIDIGIQCLLLTDNGLFFSNIEFDDIVCIKKRYYIISMKHLTKNINTQWMVKLSKLIISLLPNKEEDDDDDVKLEKIQDSSLYYSIKRCLEMNEECRRFVYI